jgi:hypothetical protein
MEIPFKATDIAGLVVLASAIVALIYVHQHFRFEHDPREPPLIRHTVPYIGHIIGIFRHGLEYFDYVKLVAVESTTRQSQA